MLPDALQSLPYFVHTNRELGLLLSGKKPLAMFVDGQGCFPECLTRYLRLFDRHVDAGRIVRRDHLTTINSTRNYIAHRILFALPAETWRIDAMIELKESFEWTRAHERREGELRGYEGWMNDHWLDLHNPAVDGL
jgi:hypothetical protein